MPRYVSLGKIPPKRHIAFRKPDGGLYSEQVLGVHGFSGIQSIAYHINMPTRVKAWEARGPVGVEFLSHEPLRHRHLKTAALKPCGDPITGRIALLGNGDVVWHHVWAADSMDYFFKNADGDELLFMHDGSGVFESQFGDVPYKPGDYIVVPRGTIYRIKMDSVPQRMICILSTTHIEIPKRYRNNYGQLLEHAPFCERDIRPPVELKTYDEKGDFKVLVRARNELTEYTYDFHPFDVVGWDGYVYPWAFNINDFSPITGKLHMPPPIHQTFEAGNYVVCSFCPRMLDYHPEAVTVPYVHSNIDSDEVLYYVNGNFGSRKGIEEGSITLHPLGIPHGPQPGLAEKSIGATRTEELAVMLDTFRPLYLTKDAVAIEDGEYWKSWMS
ncbi:MAG: homogentisate 1,2-dioxygenase [Armatimonadetes bacterium]|nr:MAG: homogentisate 1,2-dioxygenase [Armatimonadota bacterium]MCE7899488.1 homogentisate 1,2-dioxygenase [Armatimonadetes bacterium ATM1]MDL1929735.1 homogentisate 1,2-dioxygenase [Fimbriimonadia bacterium ATM]MBC6970623.1 homogentisate 1,2-dioxygenase [Armatimonadota bacterium]MBL1150144.1 homogentisate 1,2-dioxygenase [Armatimonadota bacterium]